MYVFLIHFGLVTPYGIMGPGHHRVKIIVWCLLDTTALPEDQVLTKNVVQILSKVVFCLKLDGLHWCRITTKAPRKYDKHIINLPAFIAFCSWTLDFCLYIPCFDHGKWVWIRLSHLTLFDEIRSSKSAAVSGSTWLFLSFVECLHITIQTSE